MVYLRLGLVGVLACAAIGVGVNLAARATQPSERNRFDKLFADGNFKDAFEGYRRLALDPKTEPDRVGTDLSQAVQCLVRLGRIDEVDAFRESVSRGPPGKLAAAPGRRRQLSPRRPALRHDRCRQVPPRPAPGRSIRRHV